MAAADALSRRRSLHVHGHLVKPSHGRRPRMAAARAQELADYLTAELAQAMAATGTAEPELAAALAVAAYRTVHLQAIRAILAGEDPAMVAAGHPHRVRSALSAVDQMTA